MQEGWYVSNLKIGTHSSINIKQSSNTLKSDTADLLEGWDISYFKGDIFRHISSSTPFLCNIRDPKYKQNNIGNFKALPFQNLIPYIDLLISQISNRNIFVLQTELLDN